MAELPRGTVTFLFTDIEGSTERWEQNRQAMAAAVARHVALLDAAIQAHLPVSIGIETVQRTEDCLKEMR